MIWLDKEKKEFIDLVKSSQARKDRAREALNFFDDQQDDTTLALIRKRFASSESFRVFTVNMVRKVVSRRATAYRIPPTRTFEGWDQQAGNALYQAANVDAVMKRASKLTKLLKTTALQVRYGDHGLSLSVLTPHILDAVYDDPEHPSRLIVTHSSPDTNRTTYSDWTATGFRRRDAQGRPITVPGNAGGVNPYGTLPFVPLFDRLPDSAFFLPGGDDLIGSQKALNVGLVNLFRSIELQAHGQAVAKGLPVGDPIATGPDKVILLPPDGEFSYAAPNAPIADILSALEFLMRQTAASNDVVADVFDLSKRAESGSAKSVERLDLREARQDDIALWRQYEARLFEVIKRVVNTHAPSTIPEGATVRVDFGELQDNLTEAELIANLRAKAELGVSSPVDAILALNPDGFASREDAYRELLRRKAETQELLLTL